MTNFARLQFCNDFATANPEDRPTAFQTARRAAVKISGLPDNGRSQKFSQGYTHAMQGRKDLFGTDADYDAGFNAWAA